MELIFIIRDQEVDGSNPFAPTNFFMYLGNLGFLQIGSIGVQHRFKQSYFRCDSLTKFGADVIDEGKGKASKLVSLCLYVRDDTYYNVMTGKVRCTSNGTRRRTARISTSTALPLDWRRRCS